VSQRSLHDGGVTYARRRRLNGRPVGRKWTRVQSSPLARRAWLISVLFLPISPHLAFGQEPPPLPREEGSAQSLKRAQEAVFEKTRGLGADESAPRSGEEAVGLRSLIKLFGWQPLTTEEEDKAKTLSNLAARMGNDPTAIIGRAQTLFRYDALEGGKRTNNLVTRFDVPYQGNFVFRADIPYVWSTPNQAGASNENGVSDLFVRTGGRVYSDPRNAIFIGMDFTFPTAEDTLGSGKYTVGPGVATAHVFPAWDSLLFTLIEHQVSVGGDPSRQSISTSSGQIFFNTIWTDQWWTRIELTPQVLWDQRAKSSMTLEFEGGYRFVHDWGLWVRPGVGLWGRNIPGGYEWNIETGIRRMFVGF